MELATKKKLKVKFASVAKMDKVSLGKNHNGIVLKCSRKPYIECKKFADLKEKFITKEKGNVIVLIDRINDNFSVGSLIRSCVYLGTEAIVVNKEDRPQLSNQLAKISGGATEVVEIVSIKFIKKFLQEAQKDGFTVISANSDKDKDDDESNAKNKNKKEEEVTTEPRGENKCVNVSLHDLPLDLNTNNIVILISSDPEAHVNSCNYHVTFPPLFDEFNKRKFPFNVIDSLNSGATMGMILSHLRFKSKLNQNKNL
jgi:hypothetical protein